MLLLFGLSLSPANKQQGPMIHNLIVFCCSFQYLDTCHQVAVTQNCPGRVLPECQTLASTATKLCATDLRHWPQFALARITAPSHHQRRYTSLLAQMTALTELCAAYCNAFKYDFKVLRHLTALRVLELEKYLKNSLIAPTLNSDGWPEALQNMPNLERLKTFGLVDELSVPILAGLTRLSSLRLTCKDARYLNPQVFSTLTNLQILNLGTRRPEAEKDTTAKAALNLPYLYDEY